MRYLLLLLFLLPVRAYAYEGYGSITQGCLESACDATRQTYYVTNLNDTGTGSLRNGIQDCTCVDFSQLSAGGTITTGSDVDINVDYLTIDGNTAPDPGITWQTGSIDYWITVIGDSGSGGDGAHDIIIRGLRMKGNDAGHIDSNNDVCSVDGDANGAYNIIYDHMTCTAADDGIIDIWAQDPDNVHHISYTWSFFTHTVAAGTFTGNRIQYVTVAHNVFYHNNERQVRTGSAGSVEYLDYTNNVVYGWEYYENEGRGIMFHAVNNNTHPIARVINSWFEYINPIPDCPTCTPQEDSAYLKYNAGGLVYFDGNEWPAGETDTADTGSDFDPGVYAVTTYTKDQLGSSVVPYVGMPYPTSQETTDLQAICTAIGGTWPADTSSATRADSSNGRAVMGGLAGAKVTVGE